MAAHSIYESDLCDPDGLPNRCPHDKAIKDAGPVKQLSAPALLAVGLCKGAQSDGQSFTSDDGVAANQTGNALTKGTTLASDPSGHTEHLRVLMRPMSPKALGTRQANADRHHRPTPKHRGFRPARPDAQRPAGSVAAQSHLPMRF
jgi:hypothetical protein